MRCEAPLISCIATTLGGAASWLEGVKWVGSGDRIQVNWVKGAWWIKRAESKELRHKSRVNGSSSRAGSRSVKQESATGKQENNSWRCSCCWRQGRKHESSVLNSRQFCLIDSACVSHTRLFLLAMPREVFFSLSECHSERQGEHFPHGHTPAVLFCFVYVCESNGNSQHPDELERRQLWSRSSVTNSQRVQSLEALSWQAQAALQGCAEV